MPSIMKTSLMIIKKRKKETKQKQSFLKAHLKPYTRFPQTDIEFTV